MTKKLLFNGNNYHILSNNKRKKLKSKNRIRKVISGRRTEGQTIGRIKGMKLREREKEGSATEAKLARP